MTELLYAPPRAMVRTAPITGSATVDGAPVECLLVQPAGDRVGLLVVRSLAPTQVITLNLAQLTAHHLARHLLDAAGHCGGHR